MLRDALSRWALGEIGLDGLAEGGACILGDASAVSRLVSLLDSFPAWFLIASHDPKSGE